MRQAETDKARKLCSVKFCASTLRSRRALILSRQTIRFSDRPPTGEETWLYGLRNPFQFSWDRQTRAMFLADVGQSSREEIDVQKPSNPGGSKTTGGALKKGFVPSPCSQPTPPPGLTDPIFDYPHTTGICIIGGYLYRGNKVRVCAASMFSRTPGPAGGDFTGRIWTLHYDGHTASGFRSITSQLFPNPYRQFPVGQPC